MRNAVFTVLHLSGQRQRTKTLGANETTAPPDGIGKNLRDTE